MRWAESGGVIENLDINLGSCTTLLIYLSLTSLVFPWAAGSSKSPDNSFTPASLTSPPGRLIPHTNVVYPTFTVEIAKSHELWDKLQRDANDKHFSADTGIVVFLGVKIYPTK
jgi:hypothetical protein